MISRFLTHKPRASTSKSPARDPQRRNVYCLERELAGNCINTIQDPELLEEVANHACRAYRVTPPIIEVENKPSKKVFGESWAEPAKLVLNAGYHGCNLPTLLHELAHMIADVKHFGSPSHGKEFAGIYMWLLDRYNVLPSVCFMILADKWGVDVCTKQAPENLL